MPRTRSRPGSRATSRSPPPRSSFTASRPQPTQQPRIIPTHQPTTGIAGGIGSTIMTGMAFGAGSEIAHQAVRGIIGNSSSNTQQHQAEQNLQYNQPEQYPQYQTQNPCQLQIQNFSSCLNTNEDISACQSYADMLKECKKSKNLV